MNKYGLMIFILLMITGSFHALDVSGNFSTETRFSLTNGDYLFNQENGSLKFEQQVDDNLYGMAKLAFKYYDNPHGNTTYNSTLNADELSSLYSLQPLEISLDEAYFTYMNFIVEKLDLTAGKQRITWGTADRLNPTDILNPNDYSDPFDFGKKIPVPAVNLVYHFPALESSLQLVFEPYSSAARQNCMMINQLRSGLYAGIISNMNMGVTTFQDASAGWLYEKALTPEPNLSNFAAGVKLAGVIGGFDLSVNYVTRMNNMPYVMEVNLDTKTELLLSPGLATNVSIDSKAYTLGFYRENEVGFDFSKDTGFMLVWGEAAVTFPGEQKTVTKINNTLIIDAPLPGAGSYFMPQTNEAVVISNEAYVKYTVGCDKSFEGGWYINFQYNHGFFNERGNAGPERLQDYFLIRLEERLLSDKLKFALTGFADINNLGDAFKADDFGAYVRDNSGILGQFSIAYSPDPSVTVETGVYGIDGTDNTSLGEMKDYDMVYIKFDYSF